MPSGGRFLGRERRIPFRRQKALVGIPRQVPLLGGVAAGVRAPAPPSRLARALASLKAKGSVAATAIASLLAVARKMAQRHEQYGFRCPSCGELAYEAEVPAFGSLIALLDTS